MSGTRRRRQERHVGPQLSADVTAAHSSSAADGGEVGDNVSKKEQTMCWICYDTDDDGMVSPCECRGSMRWVHARCLLQWVTSNTADETRERLRCPHCR